jgi:hypothetical protein
MRPSDLGCAPTHRRIAGGWRAKFSVRSRSDGWHYRLILCRPFRANIWGFHLPGAVPQADIFGPVGAKMHAVVVLGTGTRLTQHQTPIPPVNLEVSSAERGGLRVFACHAVVQHDTRAGRVPLLARPAVALCRTDSSLCVLRRPGSRHLASHRSRRMTRRPVVQSCMR